jgi:glycerol-3-phosphate O-acyltransferase/dihydroxyacetone phosphate acyltransferase
VLRARVEAVNALANLFDQLEEAGSQKRIRSSAHLAQAFGESIVAQTVAEGAGENGSNSEATEGYRAVKEVFSFLRQKGAKIPTLRHGRFEGNWAAALSSEGEEYTTSDEKEEPVWVPSDTN